MIVAAYEILKCATRGAIKHWEAVLVVATLAVVVTAFATVSHSREAAARYRAEAQSAKAVSDVAEARISRMQEDYERIADIMADRDEKVAAIDGGIDSIKKQIAEANNNAKTAYGVCAPVAIDPEVQKRFDRMLGVPN